MAELDDFDIDYNKVAYASLPNFGVGFNYEHLYVNQPRGTTMPKQVTPGLNATLQSTLIKIDEQIHAIQNDIKKQNEFHGTSVNEFEWRDSYGNPIMIPLLVARSNILLAIALNNKE